MKNLVLTISLVVLLLPVFASTANALNLDNYPKLQVVADKLVAQQHYNQSELREIFADVEIQQGVLDAMQSPAEYKFTWGKYRKLFFQPDRIEQGVSFWQEFEPHLIRAEREYGVPASIIVSIIAVESKFGKYKGKYKVIDSLASLVVGFERRSKFFASELIEFLILTKENQLSPDEVMGSYAGAMGYPQFISSSYRNYAVDFSGDGSIDLINQPIDAIGSIANYFVQNGWLKDQPVSSESHRHVSEELAELASNKREVQHTAAKLRELGAPLNSAISNDEKLSLIKLNASEIVPDEKDRKSYVVRAGDTACEIAEAHNVPCKTLFKLNKLNSKGAIFRGQRLKLPPAAVKNVAKSTTAEPTGSNTKWSVSENDSSKGQDTETHKPRFFFTHENFYVITRYNQSVLYAMAVHQLSQEIASLRQVSISTSGQESS